MGAEALSLITPWTLDDALQLVRQIEDVAPLAGCHVALTGGVLYKPGARKDLDLLFYRIRQVEAIDYDVLFSQLDQLGVRVTNRYGWVSKAEYEGRQIDLFFPEADDAPNDNRAEGY